MLRRSVYPLLAVLFCLFGSAGCGSGKKGSTITGKVVLPANVHMAPNDSGFVRLVPESKSEKPALGTLDTSNLTFTLTNVPPGKYKVGVALQPYPSEKANEGREKAFEELSHRYDPETNSKLTYQVTATPEQSITIDLARGSVAK